MILQIGNRKGFTLIEVMLASVILALGAVLIYESYFTILNSYDYISDYLKVSPRMEEILWEAQDQVTHYGGVARIENQGEFILDGRKFTWESNISKAPEDDNLYKISLSLSRAPGNKKFRLLRSAYAIYEKE